MQTYRSLVVVLGIALAMAPRALGETNVTISGKPLEVQAPKYDPSEPLAAHMSLGKSVEYLDNLAAFWMQKQATPTERHARTSCGSCHANFGYMIARPLLLKEFPKARLEETRRWFDQRVANGFGKVQKSGYHHTDATTRFSSLEFVSIATGLAFHDAQTTGKLQPCTRSALSKMWALQNDGGDWNRLPACAGMSMTFPVAEFDPYYGATLAVLATSVAPEDYAKTDEARAGLAKLRRFFKKEPPPNLHHQAMLLWASMRTEGLMTPEQRAATVKKLLSIQRADGGWSTSALAPANRNCGTHFDDPSSDGYGTAFVVYVLRQAGSSATDTAIVRGIEWLKKHQRASGSWYTAHRGGHDTPEGGLGQRGLSIVNLGTAFAVMALKACEQAETLAEKQKR
jgi:squalene-hopene/tetraprenyl-beta-curcumene cyclase